LIRRLFQAALSTSLTRAWARRSKKWLAFAGALVALRALDALTRRGTKKRAA
jgi:hypothetical protein